jgi:muramidase (phage lysozyme)
MEKTFTHSQLRLLLKLTIALVILTSFSNKAQSQITYNWLGTTNSWTTASNWSPAGVPTANDIVQIGVTVTYTNQPTIASGETGYAGSITFGTKKTSPLLTVSGTLTVSANITMVSSATITMDPNTACILNLAGNINGGGTLKPSLFANSAIVMNGTSAQSFPNSTKLSGNIGTLDIQNTYYGSTADRGVTLNNTASTSVVINHLIVENNAIFNANATLTEGTNYSCTIGTNATYISRSLFNFHANDVIDPTATLEFTATNQTINLYKPNAGSTNIPPNVLFTGTNITVNGGTSPNNTTIFNVLGNLTVQNTTNLVTFDPNLTLINIDGDFKGSGALSSGSLPINIAGSWLNTATYNVGGNVTYDGNNASASPQTVATSVNYQKDVIFTGASPKQVTAGTLNTAGNIDNSAGTNVDFVTNSTTLLMDGSGTQYIKGGTAVNSTYPSNVVNGTIFNNITVTTTGTNAQVILQGNDNVSPLGILTLSSSPVTLNATSSNSLTLLSDATGSASVAAIPAGSSITGIVNVQRFIQGSSTSILKRGYRLISSPVYTGTAGGSNVFDLKYLLNSVFVTGLNGTANGFNVNSPTNNPTLYLFREDDPPPPANGIGFRTQYNWKGVAKINNANNYDIGIQKRLTTTNTADTTTTIPIGNGVLFYFRGDNIHNTTNKLTTPYSFPEDVTTTQVGTLNAGTIKVKLWFANAANSLGNTLSYTATNVNNGTSSLRGGFTCVGNPYASTINWEKYNRNGTSSSIYGTVGTTIWIFNEANNQYEAYTPQLTISSSADTTTSINPGTAIGSASNMIASGQGFFIKASAAGQTLSFMEAAKTNTQPAAPSLHNLMGKPKEFVATPDPLLRLKLSKDSINTDEIVIRLNDKTSTKFSENEDAEDIGGSGPLVSLSTFSSDTIALAIDYRPFPGKNQEIVPLLVDATASGAYQLTNSQLDDLPPLYEAWLKDAFANDSVKLKANVVYKFTIDKSNPATFGNNRFSIVIGQNPANAYQLIDFTATKVTNVRQVKVVWKTANEQNYTNFTVERSIDGSKTFNVIGGLKGTGAGTYSLLDKNPTNGQNLYRLKQENINNNIAYSKIVDIQYDNRGNQSNDNKINIYPNPTKNVVNLEIDPGLKASAYHIRIINAFGTVVKEDVSQQTSWHANISSLKPGSYLMQVTNNSNKSLIGITSFVKN